ncbi:MAG: hypothetical protein IKO29_06470 [Bacteroidales bacterium]|nr:hypothetical protein [Bacteroidales bacterium]
MDKIQYTGTNFPEVKRFCGDKILAPYDCMGFSMLSLLTDDGLETVHEGDFVVEEAPGRFRVEPWSKDKDGQQEK